MDFDTDEFPSIRRGERFTAEETNVLVREVRTRKHRIYGSNGSLPNFQEVRKTWDEIAKIVSTIEGITRTGNKCRKRYNDVRRRGNRKIAALKNSMENAESSSPSKPEEEVHSPEHGGLEIGLHGAVNEGPEEHESNTERRESEEDSKATAQTLSRQNSSVNALQPEDQLFLDLQQSGFYMLESELQGVKQVMASLHTRLNSMEVLLRPIENISYNLIRIANAVERFSSH